MINEKEYWEQIIGLILLVFATYTITKDLIDEGTVVILSNSGVLSALFYAAILDIIMVVGFRLYKNILDKKG